MDKILHRIIFYIYFILNISYVIFYVKLKKILQKIRKYICARKNTKREKHIEIFND